MIVILDTNFLIRYFVDSKTVGEESKAIFENQSTFLIVPSIVMFEMKYAIDKGKFPISILEHTLDLVKQGNCMVYPLDQSLLDYLPKELNIHDGIIFATTLVQTKNFNERICLLTKDREIKNFKQNSVEIIW